MSLPSKDLLRQLLALPSVNPEFADAPESWRGERRVTDFLENLAQDQGWKWLRQQVHPGRDNLVILLPAAGNPLDFPVQLWEVHQDTVGVQGMTVDPFAAEELNGRIYGRGACDVKGAMSAMLAALIQAAEASQRRATLLVAFTVNEECGFTGAKALARAWATAEQLSSFPPAAAGEQTTGTLGWEELQQLRPTCGVVAEPTDLQLVVAHKGIARWRCHTRGRAAHSSEPESGKNAVYAMADVVTVIRRYDREVLLERNLDGLCGRPTVSVNTLHGGTGANVVPDHAVIDIDRRLSPGEIPAEAYQELCSYIADHAPSDAEIEHEEPWNTSRGLQAAENRPWAQGMAKTLEPCGLNAQTVGVPYGTDAWVYASIGIPTVVFGPGSIAQAHTEDEWILLSELERGTAAYLALALA